MTVPATILVVDDDLNVHDLITALFHHDTYQLTFVASGNLALSRAHALQPDLVLLDVMMPEMDGFEVCRQFRSDPSLAEVPIILLTALDDRDSRLEGLSAGADDFVSKPFDRMELRTRVRSILRLNRYRRLIEERSQRQLAELEATQLRNAQQLKNQFVSDVAHELRTPLSVVTLLVGNLATNYRRLADKERQNMVITIRDQLRVLNDLVQNVLEISRLEHGIAPQHHQIDLSVLIQDETERQLPLISRKRQHIKVDCDRNLLIVGDETHIRQILRNLLNNAIKYTDNGGSITIEAHHTTTGQHPWPGNQNLAEGQWVGVVIGDTGQGIAPDHLPHIFERFYRATPNDHIGGTGLGLAIAHDLVQTHHGMIAVESNLGVGSHFAVYLPHANNHSLISVAEVPEEKQP